MSNIKRHHYKKTYDWSPAIAYLVGLFAADGCLINDGRHLNLTSKDWQLIELTQSILGMHVKVPTKVSSYGSTAYHLQFSNVALYDFFLQVGLMPVKSKTIGRLHVPDALYADFLRGTFDGDGSVYGYQDTRWRSSFMYYSNFASASAEFLMWLRATTQRLAAVSSGTIKHGVRAYVLTYAKADSRKLFDFMYRDEYAPRLTRKYAKFVDFIEFSSFDKMVLDARVLKSVDRPA